MKMDFNELKTTITENESKSILNMFEMLLKEQLNYLKDERSSSVKETINQACFISLGLDGVADGIFFPNAQFNFIHMKRNFICLCIYKNKPAICYTHEKIEGYFIEYMENIIYSYEERETRKNLLSFGGYPYPDHWCHTIRKNQNPGLTVYLPDGIGRGKSGD